MNTPPSYTVIFRKKNYLNYTLAQFQEAIGRLLQTKKGVKLAVSKRQANIKLSISG